MASLTPPSDFQLRVYYILTNCVSPGTVTTYGALAKVLGGVSAQAVGGALSRNSFAPHVPCHRVVKSDCKIGGFSGNADPASANVRKKVALLRAEGVDVQTKDDQYIVPKKCIVVDLKTTLAAIKRSQLDTFLQQMSEKVEVAKKSG